MPQGMVGGQSRGEGRGRPNGRALHPGEYHPHQDPDDSLEPPYYVQDLNKHRSLDDVKKLPEDYRHGAGNEPLYHQPPTPLETHDRYHGGCVREEVPGLVAAGGNSLTSPYFAQQQLRMGQGGGRRFSPLRLPLGASGSSWRQCSWRCTAVIFVCVTLCLAATTTFLATSQVGRWQSSDSCLGGGSRNDLGVSLSPAINLPPPHHPPPPPGNPTHAHALNPAPATLILISSLSSMYVDGAPGQHTVTRASTTARLSGMEVPHLPPAPSVSVAVPTVYHAGWQRRGHPWPPVRSALHDNLVVHSDHDDVKQPLSSQGRVDDLHVHVSLYPLDDVSQEPKGSLKFTEKDTGLQKPTNEATRNQVFHTKTTTKLQKILAKANGPPATGPFHDVSRSMSEEAMAFTQEGPRSTGNKLSALDTRSSGIDLKWTGRQQQSEELALGTLQENLVAVNHGYGSTDNIQEMQETLATHKQRSSRQKRSAEELNSQQLSSSSSSSSSVSTSPPIPAITSSLSSLDDGDIGFATPPPSLPNSSYMSSLSSATSPLYNSSVLSSESPVETAQGTSSAILMNNQATSDPPAPPKPAPSTTAVTRDTLNNLISPTSVSAPVTTVSSGNADNDAAAAIDRLLHNHDSSTSDGEENLILDETWDDILGSHEGTISPDHTNAATSRRLEKNPPQENASLYDYEYQVTPGTLSAPLVSPPFQGTGENQEGVVESGPPTHNQQYKSKHESNTIPPQQHNTANTEQHLGQKNLGVSWDSNVPDSLTEPDDVMTESSVAVDDLLLRDARYTDEQPGEDKGTLSSSGVSSVNLAAPETATDIIRFSAAGEISVSSSAFPGKGASADDFSLPGRTNERLINDSEQPSVAAAVDGLTAPVAVSESPFWSSRTISGTPTEPLVGGIINARHSGGNDMDATPSPWESQGNQNKDKATSSPPQVAAPHIHKVAQEPEGGHEVGRGDTRENEELKHPETRESKRKYPDRERRRNDDDDLTRMQYKAKGNSKEDVMSNNSEREEKTEEKINSLSEDEIFNTDVILNDGPSVSLQGYNNDDGRNDNSELFMDDSDPSLGSKGRRNEAMDAVSGHLVIKNKVSSTHNLLSSGGEGSYVTDEGEVSSVHSEEAEDGTGTGKIEGIDISIADDKSMVGTPPSVITTLHQALDSSLSSSHGTGLLHPPEAQHQHNESSATPTTFPAPSSLYQEAPLEEEKHQDSAEETHKGYPEDEDQIPSIPPSRGEYEGDDVEGKSGEGLTQDTYTQKNIASADGDDVSTTLATMSTSSRQEEGEYSAHRTHITADHISSSPADHEKGNIGIMAAAASYFSRIMNGQNQEENHGVVQNHDGQSQDIHEPGQIHRSHGSSSSSSSISSTSSSSREDQNYKFHGNYQNQEPHDIGQGHWLHGSGNQDRGLYDKGQNHDHGSDHNHGSHGNSELEESHSNSQKQQQSHDNASKPASSSPGISSVMTTDDEMFPQDPADLPLLQYPPPLSSPNRGHPEETEDGGSDWQEKKESEEEEEAEDETDLTPFSGISPSYQTREDNEHSYVEVRGSLALPVIGDISLQRKSSILLAEPDDPGVSSQEEIGVNDVTLKEERNKLLVNDRTNSSSSDNSADREDNSNSNQRVVELDTSLVASPPSPPLPPPPAPSPANHNVILSGENKHKESLEPSPGKQSGLGPLEASRGPGYSERKESSINTLGSEANQGHYFLSRSNQVVADPNLEADHAQVSLQNPIEKNRDQIPPSSSPDPPDMAEEEEEELGDAAININEIGGSDDDDDDDDDDYEYEDDIIVMPEYEDDEYEDGTIDLHDGFKVESNWYDDDDDDDGTGDPSDSTPVYRDSGSWADATGGRHYVSNSEESVNDDAWLYNTSSISHYNSDMPDREFEQSPDPTCKCSCQCDGGENPQIMQGRVAANLNSGDPGDDNQVAGATPHPPPLPQHRHRHHHGERGMSSHSHHHAHHHSPSVDSSVYQLRVTDRDPDNQHDPLDRESETLRNVIDDDQIHVPVDAPPAPLVTHVITEPDRQPDELATSSAPNGSTALDQNTTVVDPELALCNTSGGGVSVIRPHQVAPPDGASFSALALGEEAAFTLAPYGYWNLHLTLNDPTDLRITLTIPRGTSLGLYARRSSLPTHTQHDIMRILRGNRQRDVRSSPSMVEVSVEEVLDAGDWFLSIYNDDGDPHQVALVISRGPGGGECPQRCHERGHCILGRCQCAPGYSGVDCSQVLCPVLCSGHGDYVAGQCKCHPGFKGKECQLRHHECEVPDCHGHGHCVDGRCHCAKGYTGEFCETVDCPHPTCSGHGWCVGGTCVCQKGWGGGDCSEMDMDALQCLPDCNSHGAFSIEAHSCVCHPPWTGSDCSKKACSLECGPHGTCENEACTCHKGWTGTTCSQRLCDPRCSEHGQCKNGTCVCMTGWNGRHCTLSGCPGNCRNRGTCEADSDGTWMCSCETGWDGPDCSAKLETQCNDKADNDRDGLTDCQDPECCSHEACKDSQLCVSRANPIDILLRKQPPGATASFFEKMRFLIEEDSLQHFTNTDTVNNRRAAVVRGRVVTSAGRGVVGLRVSTLHNIEGFTLTRGDGWFDIMVNGGGAVSLSFGKPPFAPKLIRVMVPWNEVVVLDDIIMTVSSRPGNAHEDNYHDHPHRRLSSHCPHHDYDLLRPVVMSTWQNGFQGECPDVDAILVEAQAVQESIKIPGTGLYLVYHSSRANGYESTLRLQLTPDRIPTTLRRVHLRIVLEGILFTRIFEADPAIKFTYAWNRMNVYRQRVYGVTVARVSVGYEHVSCSKIIWEHQTARVAGYDLLISWVGGFNLHVHHAYNFHQGILQKGDGQNIHLAGQRHLVTTLLGTGEQREVNCGERCEGRADHSPVLAPTCLAAAPDGSLYVGDFNLIRRVKPDGTVITVAKLNETRVSYRYHVAVSPLDGSVYVSDPEAHQVLRLEATDDVEDPLHNTVAVVGSGQRCLPGDRNKCGDGGRAIHARLTYPKGLAISSDGDVYIADGTNIRVVTDGNIHTLIGGHDHRSHWAPVPCNGTINMDQLHLRWPTELAISPLDGSLHILDDHLVLRVTPDSRVQVLTGRSLNCPTPAHDQPDVSRTALLLNPQSIAFSPQGELYIGESDTQRINRVRVITSDGRISTFAGADSRCNCRDPMCYCNTFDNVSAKKAVFSSISSIAVTPDGVLHISDQAGYRVRSVKSLLPEVNEQKQHEIFSPDTHEVYVFNRFGQHLETRNLVTGQTIYKFAYSVNTSTGRLSSVTDAAGNRFQLIRNYFGDVTAIEIPQTERVKIVLSMMKTLEELVAPDGYNVTFRYHGASGLMHSKIEAVGRSYSYEYDEQGRLTQAVMPTGQVIHLNFDLSVRGAQVTVTRDGKDPVVTRVRGNTFSHHTGPVEAVVEMDGDAQLRIISAWDHEVSLERTSYRVLESTSPTAAQMFPVLARQQTHISGDLVNHYEWNYSPASTFGTENGLKVSGTLKVNGADLITLSYDWFSSSEALLSVSGQMLVNITYDSVGRPVKWVPVSPLVPTNVTYDDWGYITSWIRGNHSEEYHYDQYLRLESVTYADGATVNYDYRDRFTKPEKVTHPSGRAYGLVYDGAGSLRQVVTPRGTAYTLHLSTSLGFYRLRLALPVDSVSLQMRLDERGRLLAMTLPGQGGTLLYEYSDVGQVTTELYGYGYTEYSYYDTGLIRTARTKHSRHDVRTDYRYHAGLMKEMRLRYGSKSDLKNVRLRFQYDGSARLRKLEGEINSTPLDEVYLRFDNQTGVLQLISDLRIIRNNILETMIQNPKKHYVNTRKQDNYGRLAQVDMTLQGRTVYTMQLKYDNRNRISERLIEVAGRREGLNITYVADGQILEASGTHTWMYGYDENGNIISNMDTNPITELLQYDECDRVTTVGDTEVEYDERGFVVRVANQNFDYNTKGQLVSAWDRDDNWSFTLGYDHLGRVSVYRNHQNNVTQLIYGRPDLPDLITHLHNPHTGTSTTLLYDDMNHLIAVDQPDGRYFVATDQNGTPIAIFDDVGSLIRSQVWSPFGRLVNEAGAKMWVGVGPWGGFLEPITGLILIKGHAYHPKVLQWLAPRWGHLTQPTRHVTDVFVYRFMKNDPFNPPTGLLRHYYTDVSEWMDLYGIELNRVLGSEYHEDTMVVPRPVVEVDSLGSSEVVSGLWCQYKAGISHLHDLSFFSQSHIKRRIGTWNDAPISRQASIFGPGVLVSNIDGRVLVTGVGEDEFSGVIGDVIRTVLNNSIILDVSATHNGLDTFYFIKDGRNRANEDIQHLRRLSGIFNISSSETDRGQEIRMSTPTANLVILYGERISRARNRVLLGLEQKAEELAWAREAALVRAGRPGSHSWSAAEAAELAQEGRVPGFVASHIHSPSHYPLLAADASNIMFKHESSRKRRKSRRKGHKKTWRQRKKSSAHQRT